MSEYQTLKFSAAKIKTRMDQIKTLLGDAMPDGGTIGDHKISIVRGRINWARVAKAYPAQDHPQLYKQEISLDQKKAEALIAPAQLDEYRGEPSVSIR
ncbi:hypothetical protein [Trueperella pyogenes]|uniref:hypothetical protein n=1 Tax=Trueperella pyogenes TaxID=1661 RepID=UPI0024C0E161|nr:hypothetical protein [Trueperella pyogenes]WHU57075.1 hypothetical protein QEV10_10150 [Trueperella pyogenes]